MSTNSNYAITFTFRQIPLGLIVPLLSFNKDGFGIELPKNFDMSLNNEINPPNWNSLGRDSENNRYKTNFSKTSSNYKYKKKRQKVNRQSVNRNVHKIFFQSGEQSFWKSNKT